MSLTTKQESFATACAKGENASDAYRSAYKTTRMTPKTVHEEASRLLANPKVAARIAELRVPAMKAARLEIEEVQRQHASVLRSDPRKLFRADGSMVPVHELDDETAAAISSIEVREEFEGSGEERKLVGYTKKIRFWDKTAALNMAMRHFGQFERDNVQQRENLTLIVNLVDGKPATNGHAPVPIQAKLIEGKVRTAE